MHARARALALGVYRAAATGARPLVACPTRSHLRYVPAMPVNSRAAACCMHTGCATGAGVTSPAAHAASSGGRAASSPASASGAGVAVGMDRSRTDITRTLWERRKAASQRKVGTLPPRVIVKTPADSVESVPIPFNSDPLLRAQYVNFNDHLRFGKLLEDLDAFACNVAHSHCDDGDPETRPIQLVTASVDSVEVHQAVEPLIDHDLQLQGVVSWVGRSSIEVQATVVCEGSPALTATFVMVAKDPHTGKTIEINRLKLVTPEDEQRWEDGKQRMAARISERDDDLFVSPPHDDEVGLLHDMLLSIAGGPTTGTGWGGGVPAADDVPAPASGAVDSVRMADTRIWGSRLMQPQEMNSSNNIFGGYIMRVGFELAKANALTFCGAAALASGHDAYPLLLAVNDITFAHPVSIGNLLELSSRVVYTNDACFQIRLEVKAVDLRSNATPKPIVTTNVLHFTFACRRAAGGDDPSEATALLLPVPHVRPMNYRQGMLTLDGRRRMRAAKEDAVRHAGRGTGRLVDMYPKSW